MYKDQDNDIFLRKFKLYFSPW